MMESGGCQRAKKVFELLTLFRLIPRHSSHKTQRNFTQKLPSNLPMNHSYALHFHLT